MAKAKKKQEKLEREFVVGLQPVFDTPRSRRADKAISLIKRFIFKHFRIEAKDVLISNKVNEFVWQGGREKVPRKIEIKVIVTEGKANVFLRKEKASLPKKEEKAEKEPAEKKTEEEKKEEKEKEKKKEEKKMAEKAAEMAAMKRGTQ